MAEDKIENYHISHVGDARWLSLCMSHSIEQFSPASSYSLLSMMLYIQLALAALNATATDSAEWPSQWAAKYYSKPKTERMNAKKKCEMWFNSIGKLTAQMEMLAREQFPSSVGSNFITSTHRTLSNLFFVLLLFFVCSCDASAMCACFLSCAPFPSLCLSLCAGICWEICSCI